MLLYVVSYLRNRNVFKTSLLEMEEDKTENVKHITSLNNLTSNTNKTINSTSTNGRIEKHAFSRIMLNIQSVDKFEFSPYSKNKIGSKKEGFLINQFDFSIMINKTKRKIIKRNYFSFHQKDLVLFDFNVRI